MTQVVVRFAKRKAVWETADAAQIRDVEFRDKDGGYDLRPSVYEIDQHDMVRAFAEHAAAAPIDPPGRALAINLHGSRFALAKEPGNDTFAFTRDRHRELVLSTQGELDEVIKMACQDLAARQTEITKESVHYYVSGRLAAEDREWCELLASTDAKDWLKKLDAKRKGGAK